MPIAPVVNELVVPHLPGSVGAPVAEPRGPDELPFASVLQDAVASANRSANAASRVAESFAAGTSDDIHGTMIAIKEADIELKLVANVRSKLVDAFNDLWRMNI
jgi:flagellar hook-basal body complex protein FliE